MREEVHSRFAEVLDALPDGCAIYDAGDRLAAFNPAYRRIYGERARLEATFAEVEGEARWGGLFVDPDDFRVSDWFRQRLQPGHDVLSPVDAELADRRWLRLLSRRTDDGGHVEMRVDITDLKNAEDRLNRAQEISQTGTWEGDFRSKTLTWSEQTCRIFGIGRDEFGGTEKAFFELVHPDDRDWLAKARADWLDRGGMLDVDHRIVRPDGEVRWVRYRATVISDENGIPGFAAGTVQDVTEHRAMRDLAEIRSRQLESEANKRLDLINVLPAQIAVLDRDGTIVEVNEKWRRFALENRNPDPQFSVGTNYLRICERGAAEGAEGAAEAADGLRSVLSGERDSFAFEYPCHAPDENRWFRFSITCLAGSLADFGSGRQAVAMHVDITERVESDLQLRQSEEHYRTVFDVSLSGIAIVSLEGTILEANPAYCRILGRSEDELREITVLSILHPDDLAGFAEKRRLLLSGELDRLSEECRYLRPDGSVVWVRTRAKLIQDGPTNPSRVLAMVDDITARKESERALAEREQLLTIAGQTARLGGWRLDLPERMLTFSREALRIRGLSEEQQRLPLEDVFRNILPEDRDVCRNTIEACIREGVPYVIEVRPKPVKGGEIWIRISGTPVYDGQGQIVAVQGSVQDITEQRTIVSRLEYVSDRLQDVLEAVSDSFFSIDRHWRFTHSNTAYEKIVGRYRHEILGQIFWEVFPQYLGTKLEENLRLAMERSETVKFRFLSGVSGRWLDVSAYPTAEGLAVFATDVTDRLEFERQLAHTARLASMGEMAASLTHEINQPLSAISMAAENAIMEIEAGDVDMDFVFAKLNTVLAQVDKQRKIIDHVKAFSRLDDHGGEPFDPSGPLHDAVKMLGHEFRNSGIELDFVPPHSVPTVLGYAVRLEQVIVNLMTNARDAIIARSEREPSAERRISVSISSGDQRVRIAVTDTGGGIPTDSREKIFEPFFTTKGVGEGTGLGLAVSRSIVNNMGGMLLVENADDGACFTISLPISVGVNTDR